MICVIWERGHRSKGKGGFSFKFSMGQNFSVPKISLPSHSCKNNLNVCHLWAKFAHVQGHTLKKSYFLCRKRECLYVFVIFIWLIDEYANLIQNIHFLHNFSKKRKIFVAPLLICVDILKICLNICNFLYYHYYLNIFMDHVSLNRRKVLKWYAK